MNILIVDDSKLNRVHASSFIEKSDLDLVVYFAESGEEALEAIHNIEIHIVLLDIMMPGIDGIETLRQIKKMDNKRDIKVIMYSTISEKSLLKECFELGASDFIHKPIEEIEFISRVSNTFKQKKLEDQTLSYIEEIKAQQHVIAEANLQLMQQEKMAGIGQLAAGVAHEINNPLGFIASNFTIMEEYSERFETLYKLFFSEYSSDEELIEKVKTYFVEEDFVDMFEDLSDLYEETKIGLTRVTDIVKSLRNFSRIDTIEDFDYYNVNQGIKDTLIIANNNIKYNAQLHAIYGQVGEVYAIGNQVNQVVLNLVLNGVDAIKEKSDTIRGDLFVETSMDDDFIMISVKDTGVGISEENLSNLFNPFFTTKPVGKGLGLGLSVSYDIIVNKHKGKLLVDSEEGAWTEFKIYLPRTTTSV
jgi:signal transduction histidine kinase